MYVLFVYTESRHFHTKHTLIYSSERREKCGWMIRTKQRRMMRTARDKVQERIRSHGSSKSSGGEEIRTMHRMRRSGKERLNTMHSSGSVTEVLA